ncbi:MAG: hypothetical protein ACTSPI_00010 [Candidatus Heimdallarchaeaceae archaeon]
MKKLFYKIWMWFMVRKALKPIRKGMKSEGYGRRCFKVEEVK